LVLYFLSNADGAGVKQMTRIAFDALKLWIQKHPDRAAVLFLVLFSCFFVFVNLGSAALIDWDESIYAGVAKEILEKGDWLTLHWNGEVWFEKPPLYFWLTAFTYSISGVNEFAARFWSAVLGVVGIVAVYFFGKKMFGRLSGFAAALILASTPHWILQSRNGTLDIMAATFITLTLYSFWRARAESKFWKFCGIFLGLTFMTKSAIAIIPLLVMLIFAALEIWWSKSFQKYPLSGVLSFILYSSLIVLPWHFAMYLIHGRGFVDEYFFYHILSRTKGIEGHDQPWFWYFIVIQHWARYWYLAFLAGIYLLAGFLVRDGVKKHLKGFFLFSWFLWGLIIFSSSRSKIEWYIVPIYPAMALLIGSFVPSVLKVLGSRKRWALLLLVLFCFLTLWHSSYLWNPGDFNRNVAEVAKKARQFLSPNDELLVANLAPGPPIFYSGCKVKTIGFWGLSKKAEDGERMFVLSPAELLQNLRNDGVAEGFELFAQSGGVALYGRK